MMKNAGGMWKRSRSMSSVDQGKGKHVGGELKKKKEPTKGEKTQEAKSALRKTEGENTCSTTTHEFRR